jgi:hypothetical protein
MVTWMSESAGASTDSAPFVLVVVLTAVLRIRVGGSLSSSCTRFEHRNVLLFPVSL